MLHPLERLTPAPRTTTPRNRQRRPVVLQTQPFHVAHQRVTLDLDFPNRAVAGSTELTLEPTGPLRSVRLDARGMSIRRVLVNGLEMNYAHNDTLYLNGGERIAWGPDVGDRYLDDFTVAQHHLVRQKLAHVFGHVDEEMLLNTEELVVYLEGHKPETWAQHPIRIGIDYDIVNPRDGLHFRCDLPDPAQWHAYTTNSDYGVSASLWVPCIDNLTERCTWLLELVIPRSTKDCAGSKSQSSSQPGALEAAASTASEMPKDADHNDDEEDRGVDLVVVTGDHVNTKETAHPTNISKKIVLWSVFNSVCAHHMGWAVGAFQTCELTDFADEPAPQLDDDEFELLEKDEATTAVLLCFLPGREEEARNTAVCSHKALEVFLKKYGLLPFVSYAMVFVDSPPHPHNNYAGLAVLGDSLMYPPNVIEPMFLTTENLIEGIAAQWAGINIVPQTYNDLWLTIGIARYMALTFTRTLLGQNEFRYQIQNKMRAIVRQDRGQRPLGNQTFHNPILEAALAFVRLKAPIVLFILDRRMTKTDKSFGFSRVLPKIFLQAMLGDLPSGALSTQHFQYVCEKVNRNRLDTFFKQWVYGTGTPIFAITQRFNKKRLLIEVLIRQTQALQTPQKHATPESFMRDASALLNEEQHFPIQPTFFGPMTIRVHEADGTPYEHIVDIKDTVVKFDVQYNTKFRRLKKKNDQEALVFTRLGDVLQSPEEMRAWNLEEWPKRDEDFFDPFEWLRVDTDSEWIASYTVSQPDYMYASQIQQDKDIEAQIAAAEFFGSQEKSSVVHCTMLIRTLMDQRYFYGVRIAAAQALARLAKPKNNFFGLDYLVKAIKALFFYEDSLIPKRNNFLEIDHYFLQKSIPKILASVRDEKGMAPPSVLTILYNLVKYNDNSDNDFSDSFYACELLEALVAGVVPSNEDEPEFVFERELEIDFDEKALSFIKKTTEELDRVGRLDAWLASYHSIVSVTSLQQRILMARNGLLELPMENLLHMTHPKNPPAIRIEAFKGLFMLGGLKNAEIMDYYLRTCLLEDSSPRFQDSLVNALIEAVSDSAIHGIPSTIDDEEFAQKQKSQRPNNMVVLDESNSEMSMRHDAVARETTQGAILILRRDVAIGTGIRNALWEMMHTTLLSLHSRLLVFVLCDVLFEAVNYFPVKLAVPCVPLDELKKKIVAKHLGSGRIVIKREGRFKIQLSTKIQIEKKEDRPRLTARTSAIAAKAHDKTPAKVEEIAEVHEVPEVSDYSEPVRKPAAPTLKLSFRAPEKVPETLVTRASRRPMTLVLKVDPEKLAAVGQRPPQVKTESFVTVEDTIVRITLPRKPRYVRIHTQRRTVDVSSSPFMAEEPQIKQEEV